ncbi:hypothetical protein UA08_00247 [Talaromyces atroroseus]|uniref:Sister chromatid cohesion protein Dcc1 n=1 Tax=Talaromyces atroroseus TaxID=1441469 RepID=A0A225AQY9_TALAT|nr:hypothetical protein UA08_00247 [Talaromyces atroroseus]OKL64022.1 hypothetical protein UA08_00247 [Talaromyces atroroseus]
MSTQTARAIRFTHTAPQQAFRLLELTPEILELISSENAPTLYLKSPGTDNTTTTGPEDTGADNNNAYVNLCTPTKTFRIRQVQSSNSIHVIKPSDEKSEVVPLIAKKRRQSNDNSDINNDEMDIPESVTAIAKCASTLEIHALNHAESLAEAKRTLRRILPVYDTNTMRGKRVDDGDVEMAGVHDSNDNKRGITKDAIFDDLPFAKSQCQMAWFELCAFVPDDGGLAAFRPSARIKLELWRMVLEGCILQNIDLEKQFLVADLWKAALGEDNDENGKEETFFSKTLFDAVVRRLAEGNNADSELKWSNMDKKVCIQWIGETYLEATAPNERLAIGRSEFLNAWKDLLPETWRDEASLNSLPEYSYKYPDPVSICFIHEAERERVKRETKNASGNVANAKNSRNWHERFKNQRK